MDHHRFLRPPPALPPLFPNSAADVNFVFDHLDTDGSGHIDYVELNAQLRPKTCPTQCHKLRTQAQLKRGSARRISLQGRKSLDTSPGAPSVQQQLAEILRVNFLRVLDVFKVAVTFVSPSR